MTFDYTPFSHITQGKRSRKYYRCKVCGKPCESMSFCSDTCKKHYATLSNYRPRGALYCRHCGDTILTSIPYDFCCERCYINYKTNHQRK